jgi:tetratricopeptide (TPR) repeat protein
VYRQPDLKDALIVDNKILASQMDVAGFSKGGNYLDVLVEMERTNFQDNQGKTFANQPVRIVGKQNGVVKLDKTYFSDFAEIASVPTNEINLNVHEKRYLQRTMDRTRNIINDHFGYQTINSSVTLETVKNKGDYDDLEKAYIYVTTNLKKLQAKSDYAPNKVAMENMQKGIEMWKTALGKVNYNDKKAFYNQKIGEYLYFNLIRLNLALGNYTEAEKYLNELQEHLVDIKLSYDANLELKRLEEKIYNN